MNIPIRRLIVLALAPTFLAPLGCGGGNSRLERQDLIDPPPAKSYRVETRDGRSLTFIALHMEDDWLVGTVRQTSTEEVGEGEARRANVSNRYEEMRVAWIDVETVEAEGTKEGPSGLLLAGGAIAAGALAFLLLGGGGADTPDDGGGKGF